MNPNGFFPFPFPNSYSPLILVGSSFLWYTISHPHQALHFPAKLMDQQMDFLQYYCYYYYYPYFGYYYYYYYYPNFYKTHNHVYHVGQMYYHYYYYYYFYYYYYYCYYYYYYHDYLFIINLVDLLLINVGVYEFCVYDCDFCVCYHHDGFYVYEFFYYEFFYEPLYNN